MKNRKPKIESSIARRLRPFALALASAVVLAAGTASLAATPETISLKIAADSPAQNLNALRGYDFTTQLNDSRGNTLFHIRDGHVESEKAVPQSGEYSDVVHTAIQFAIPTQDHATAESAATQDDGGWVTAVDRVDAIATLYLPDNTRLRFCSAQFESDKPLVARAESGWSNGNWYQCDYLVSDIGDNERSDWYRSFVGMNAAYHDGGWQFGFEPAEGSIPAGVYRVDESLTGKQIDALPKDATVHGVPVSSNSTPYGSFSPVYTLPDGAALNGFGYADGTLCVAYTQNDQLWADVVDEEGVCTDRSLLHEIPQDMAGYTTNSLPQMQPDCFAMQESCYDAATDTILGTATTLLQVKAGKITTHVTMKDAKSTDSFNSPRAVLLNESEGTVLSITGAYTAVTTTINGRSRTVTKENGYHLAVYPLAEQIETGTDAPLLHALLDSGAVYDWPRGYADNGENHFNNCNARVGYRGFTIVPIPAEQPPAP